MLPTNKNNTTLRNRRIILRNFCNGVFYGVVSRLFVVRTLPTALFVCLQRKFTFSPKGAGELEEVIGIDNVVAVNAATRLFATSAG